VIDYAGPLQRLALSKSLWTIVAPPLLAFAWHVALGRRRATRASGETEMARAVVLSRGIGIASMLAVTVATVAHEVLIARTIAGPRALFEPLVRCARIGQLDVGIDLLFDRFSAVACCLVCVVALGVAGLLARNPPTPGDWRAWAWLELTVGGALLASVADGFVATAVGWTLVVAAATWIASWSDGRAAAVIATRGAAGIATLTIAASLLFWGFGGAWWEAEYLPDPGLRFAAMRSDEESPGATPQATDEDPDEPGPGSITLTSMPGASVFIDEARTPAMRAPFVRAALPAGSHVLRVHPGGATADVAVGPFTLGSGETITLVQFGPTLSFREMATQLVVREGSDERESRRAVAQRASPFGVPLVAVALALLALAAGAMSAAAPSSEVPPALRLASRAIGVVVGPFVLARVAFLAPFAYAPGERALVVAGAVVVATAVWLSGRHSGSSDALFARGPERLGALVVSFERWVIDSVAGALGVLVRAAAWIAARTDVDAIGAPADAVAARVVRVGRATEGVIGQPLGWVAWALVAVLASVVIGHAVWPGR
jgi:hypothetical protein